jgi:hypothetical protein
LLFLLSFITSLFHFAKWQRSSGAIKDSDDGQNDDDDEKVHPAQTKD